MAGNDAAPKSESLADKIKNNIVVVIVGVFVAAIGAGVAFTKLVYDAKLEQAKLDYQEENSSLKQSLGSIQRTIGDHTENLDVGGVLVSQDRASKLGGATYFSDSRYYALHDSAQSDWTAHETNEWQLFVDSAGLEQTTKFFDATTPQASGARHQ